MYIICRVNSSWTFPFCMSRLVTYTIFFWPSPPCLIFRGWWIIQIYSSNGNISSACTCVVPWLLTPRTDLRPAAGAWALGTGACSTHPRATSLSNYYWRPNDISRYLGRDNPLCWIWHSRNGVIIWLHECKLFVVHGHVLRYWLWSESDNWIR